MRMLAGLVVVAVSCASTVHGESQCFTTSTSTAAPHWTVTVQVPRFDPALGTLTSVDVSITGQMLGTYSAESVDSFPLIAVGQPMVQLELSRPDMTTILSALPTQSFTDSLSVFDGTLDFGGTSGVMHAGIDVSATTQISLTSPADQMLFTGAPGNPGSVVLDVEATDMSIAMAPTNLITQFALQAGAMISICYDYTPVAAPFCFGDGTGTACPCGNDSPIGANAGCSSSFGVGAALRGYGVASLASDSLVLTCTGLPATAPGLFYQGTAQLNGGAGIVFGDGLRCVTGPIVRVSTKIAVAGTISYPQAGDVSISVRGSPPANSTRHYQAWYRNMASFCTVSTFNLSEAVTVPWHP